MKSQNDVDVLQSDLNQLTNWSRKWPLKFNEQKCKVMHFGHQNASQAYWLNNTTLESTRKEKDLGIYVTDNLKFSNHITKIAAKANSVLGRIN